MVSNYVITENSKATFINNGAFCVGTGRMGLALQREYYEQLALVQREAGFSYIRGHGLFCDDMAIYNEFTDSDGSAKVEYNFTYLDRVFDMYLELNVKPFLELGFMPYELASGSQTIFYWKGNTTPPADYDKWAGLVKALFTHLIDRYGINEVALWPVEVWNEPNLAGFWENADIAEYKKLYRITAEAVKAVSPRLRVGGPSICGADGWEKWMKSFLEFCRDENVPLDFVTRHVYMANTPSVKERYVYHTMRSLDSITEELKRSREIIDGFDEYRGMEMHITEFNTSYNPRCPIHDTNLNAALTAGILAYAGDTSASYSYWTFGDVFEETGVPFTPFHGGFGLVANGCIPKPTLWTFAFFKELDGDPAHRSPDTVVVKKGGCYRGVCWNIGKEPLEIRLELACADGEYALIIKTVDEECCNPLKVWHDLGEPSCLTKRSLELLRSCAYPSVRTENHCTIDGKLCFSLRLNPNAVVNFELEPVVRQSDRGYDYEFYCGKQ